MKAVELQKFGLDGLEVVGRDIPEPGYGEVVVKINAASLNYHDLVTVMGLANPKIRHPLVPLSDGAGYIHSVGEGVTGWEENDRVTTLFFPRWMAGGPDSKSIRRITGEHFDGACQEYMVMDADALIATPEHLTDMEASTLPCAALTAWRSLVVEGNITAGDTAVIQGTGGVSIFALQFCHFLGVETIVTSSSDEKLEKAKALGATHLVNYREKENWSREVKKITEGRGADLVVEVGGSGTINESLDSIRIGGHISMIGVLSGIADVVPTAKIMALNATVQGITVGSKEDFIQMNRAISHNGLKPVISHDYKLAEIRQAFKTMQAASHFGKIVINVEDS